MKKNKIFILAFISLILAFSCFTGFVSAPSAMAQPFDDLFPPQSDGSYYIYFDFSSCGIPASILGDTVVTINYSRFDSTINARRNEFIMSDLSSLVNFSLVYQSFLYKSWVLAYDVLDITVSLSFPDLTSYGIPSVDNVLFLDNEEVSFEPTYTLGSSFIQISMIPSDMSALVFTFANTELSLVTQYQSLQGQYNTLQGQYNTLQGQYNTLQGQYNTLQGNYSTLQGEYEELENLYEEARDNVDHYQGLLREANAEIDELSSDNDRLQGIINNLPPTDLAFGWVGSAFATVDNILSIEIIPNLTIGSLVLIPLVLGVLFFVLRLVRGE